MAKKKPKLHEIVAVFAGMKSEVSRQVTGLYHDLDQSDLFDGLQRTYKPMDDVNGEKMPAETKIAQKRVDEIILEAANDWGPMFDMAATLDRGNQQAKEDIVLPDDTVLAAAVPIPTLLFLEKQLGDVKAFVQRLPTPDPAEVWSEDANSGYLVTKPVETYRTKKNESFIVTVAATVEHPAQTQKVTKDENVGIWTTIKQTTKIPARDKAGMLERISILLAAVKSARERANVIEVEKETKLGKSLLGHVFGDYAKNMGVGAASTAD